MEVLRIYHIEDKYIRFLQGCDKRVQYNKAQKRPYVGIILYVGDYKYFVPMESPKPNHQKIKQRSHIFKLDDGKLGILGFNNMIPVHDKAIISFNVDNENDKKYAELLKRQISFINKHKATVYQKASKTYYTATKGKNEFLNKICCDFKKLERACNNYNPGYKKNNRKYK